MITSMSKDNSGYYKTLFEEATEVLTGYKRVRTYDAEVENYYKKNDKATTEIDLYSQVTGITNLDKFAEALEKHKILYKKIGEKATNFNPLVGIRTLEEYFSWLKDLSTSNIKYTVLPLDEEHFYIDANTRVISIPNAFKKNGIAVQGDDLAEIVYFEIDRYFDYMDLNTCEIYIQWETPKDPQGQTTKMVSTEYIRDIESKPGKLIFGWAITKSMTKYSGNLKFSVRFFKWNDKGAAEAGAEKKTIYTFNTLTASVPIQASIGFNSDETYDLEDIGDSIIDRIENSFIAGGYIAATPVFIKDLVEKPAGYDLGTDGMETEKYDLYVEAYSADAGMMSYVWYKQQIDDNNNAITTGENSTQKVDDSEIVYVKADISNGINPSIVYYRKEGDNYQAVQYQQGSNPSEITDTLYTKQSKCTATEAAIYFAKAENRITNSLAYGESKHIKFPKPDKIDIKEGKELAESARLAVGENGVIIPVPLGIEPVEKDNNVLSYEWYRDNNYAINGSKDSYTQINSANEATLNVSDPGYYKVKVIQTRNGKNRTLESGPCRVTPMPEAPVISSLQSGQGFQTSQLSGTDGFTISITPQENDEYDYYTVTWCLDNKEGEPIIKIVEQTLERGTDSATFNPLVYAKDIINEASDKDLGGKYYPIVTNHLNGAKAETNTDETIHFLVTDNTTSANSGNPNE